MATPQFSTPSLQELLLTARTGADRGGSAIRAAGEGFQSGMDMVNKLRAEELRRKIEERGLALKEKEVIQEGELGRGRIEATKDQIAATREGIAQRETESKREFRGQADLRSSQAELNRAKAKALGQGVGRSGSKGGPMTLAEIQQQATENATDKLKLLGNEIEFLSEPDKNAMFDRMVEAERKALTLANNKDIAASIGGTLDEETGAVQVVNESGIPGSVPAEKVRSWLQGNPKRKVR